MLPVTAVSRESELSPRGIIARICLLAGGYFLASELGIERHAPSDYHIPLHGVTIGLAVVVAWWSVIQPLRRAAFAQQFIARVKRGLEMADSQEDALRVVRRALEEMVPDRAGQLLLADSSRAHLVEAMRAGAERWSRCPVESPGDCPAIARNETLLFPSSRAIDSCPRLDDRPDGPCSAICVPVNALGHAIGVLHVTGPEGKLPSAHPVARIQVSAAELGTRLGILRAAVRAHLEASTDPLTGLLNRRSLMDQVHDLSRLGVPFAAAILDLDGFKSLNDTFGHETGDRTLRTFAHALRDAVRAHDIVARYGGDEFVVVLPRCSLGEATEVLERVRQRLETRVAEASLPPVSCTSGLADTSHATSFEVVLRFADAALREAKAAGGDRVLVSAAA